MTKLARKNRKNLDDLDELDREDTAVEAAPTKKKPHGKLDKDFYYPPAKKTNARKSLWDVTEPSKAVMKQTLSLMAMQKQGARTKAADAAQNKKASESAVNQYENENTRGPNVDPEQIAELKADEENFRETQLGYDEKAKKLGTRIQRNNALLVKQADREIENPKPKAVKFVGHPVVNFDRDKLSDLRKNKIVPKNLEIGKLIQNPPDVPFVKAERIPLVVRNFQNSFKDNIGAQLFRRMESTEKEIVRVPRVPSYFSAREGQIRETIDPFAVWAVLDPDGLTKHLERIASEYAKANNIKSIPRDEAAKRLKKLRDDLLAYEREEEALIRAAARQGMHILRRRDASLEAVFGYAWEK